MMEWLSMGGYGFYVWSSFALTFVVLAGNLKLAQRRHRKILNSIRNDAAADEAGRGSFREVSS